MLNTWTRQLQRTTGCRVPHWCDPCACCIDFTDRSGAAQSGVQGFNPSGSMELQIADINKRCAAVGREADSGVRHPATDPGQYIARMQELFMRPSQLGHDEPSGNHADGLSGDCSGGGGLAGGKVWCGFREVPDRTYTRVIQYSADAIMIEQQALQRNCTKTVCAKPIHPDRRAVAVYAVDARGWWASCLAGGKHGLSAAGDARHPREYGQNVQLPAGPSGLVRPR